MALVPPKEPKAMARFLKGHAMRMCLACLCGTVHLGRSAENDTLRYRWMEERELGVACDRPKGPAMRDGTLNERVAGEPVQLGVISPLLHSLRARFSAQCVFSTRSLCLLNWRWTSDGARRRVSLFLGAGEAKAGWFHLQSNSRGATCWRQIHRQRSDWGQIRRV